MNKIRNEVEIRQLIQQYKKHECLWNIHNPNYKDKSIKQPAWEEIAKISQKSPNEVKRKLQYLRSAYVHEKRGVDASKKSESEAPHEPLLFYYKEMNFLANIVTWRKFDKGNDSQESVGNSHDFENKEFIAFEDSQDDYLQEPEIICKIETCDDSEVKPIPTAKLKSPIAVLPSVQLPSTVEKKNVFKRLDPNTTFSNGSKSQRKLIYYSFGRTIALQLQQMPLDDAMLTMSEIQNIITFKSLENIKNLQNGYESSSESDNNDVHYNDTF